ncbi:MAG: outer membrane beta-barrel protein, partial [Alphaproteobacteria bacterium]|nr:outer membrane beta-barrel protein [Alphaproteobacteria bacterium]
MRSIGLKTLLGTAAVLLAASGAQAGAISANPNPISFDAGFGKISVNGMLSGLAFYQNNAKQASRGDNETAYDLSSAMVSVQKTDGMFQFYVLAGLYSFPTVGQPYVKANDTNSATLGAVPVAYGKLQLSDTFSIEAGKLPTLVGAELAFTPQNANIERGLLWWQEPISSRGVQANYASGPLSVSVSWNDGYYTNLWNTFSGLASYAIDSSNTIAFDTSITSDTHLSLGHQIYNLMYTTSSGPLSFGPYLQYEHYDHSGGSEWGVGALASYQ